MASPGTDDAASHVASQSHGCGLEHLPHQSVMTPPHSDEGCIKQETDLSSLDLNGEDDDEEEEIVPDHYWEGGKIPIFKPTMEQFRSFKTYISKIDKYGMKSGIVKVIPPKEWLEGLPALDEAVKTIKVKNPITQEISGKSGAYTQANIEKQRSYNLPQWKALTEETQHQPPAKRGERRRAAEKSAKPRQVSAAPVAPIEPKSSSPSVRKRGRPAKKRYKAPLQEPTPSIEGDNASESDHEFHRPPTPTSPETLVEKPLMRKTKARTTGATRGGGRQAKTVSERRKYNQHEMVDEVDEEAFEGFDYKFQCSNDFTPERCRELEAQYWKTLTYAAPMYGADMPGSLFDGTADVWNVAKLENLLDVLGTKVPGVNTAYLYLGMWKATFAWHLEDVDLYSINYIHFGAPKQWYSISQEDARRFEAAMKSLWPNDAKNCSQFLRHKTYLVSPSMLLEQFNIKVNRLVHYEGEFVITYPYGYHSGYNLGYNCAESVNFATEDWLEYGKIAKKCNCEADSVWVDAFYIERKLKGEPTPEYYEETDMEDAEEDPTQLKATKASRKRKRDAVKDAADKPKKKVKIRVKKTAYEPCCLCPNVWPFEELLPTDNDRQAHAICALYTPETYLWPEDDSTCSDRRRVYGVDSIAKERLGLRCYYCNSRKGACFQCSAKKCTRAYHATCAAAAGVRVESGRTPFFVENGDEYWIEDNDFRCRFHRVKRHKHITGDALERDQFIKTRAPHIKSQAVVQAQYLHSEIFAGLVVENRPEEQTLVVDILPEGGDRIEVEYKWLLIPNPKDSQLPEPSSNNLGPLPEQFNRASIQSKSNDYRLPLPDDVFVSESHLKWGELIVTQPKDAAAYRQNPKQSVSIDKPYTLWHYIGELSSDTKARYTGEIDKREPNPKAQFLDTVKPPLQCASPVSVSLGALQTFGRGFVPGVHALPSGFKTDAFNSQTVFPTAQVSRVPEWLLQTQQSIAPPGCPSIAKTLHASKASLPNAVDTLALSGYKWHQYHGPAHPTMSAAAAREYVTGTDRPSPCGDISENCLGQLTHSPKYLEHISRYPYLRNAFTRRSQIYKSPYPNVRNP